MLFAICPTSLRLDASLGYENLKENIGSVNHHPDELSRGPVEANGICWRPSWDCLVSSNLRSRSSGSAKSSCFHQTPILSFKTKHREEKIIEQRSRYVLKCQPRQLDEQCALSKDPVDTRQYHQAATACNARVRTGGSSYSIKVDKTLTPSYFPSRTNTALPWKKNV
jgi:hypothetical protein